MRKKWVLLPLIALWGILALGGSVVLARYSGTPGEDGTPTEHWPTDSSLPHASDQYTLIMFLHPLCPCSQASVGELARLLTSVQHRTRTLVVFTRPEGLDEYIHDDALWKRATALENVTVMEDASGAEAARFGAMTSGHTLLFDAAGHRVFTGGITPSRGHQGDNKGSTAIATLVKNSTNTTTAAHTPVFGCSLVGKAISRFFFRWTEA